MRNDEQRYIHDGRDVRFAPNSGHIAQCTILRDGPLSDIGECLNGENFYSLKEGRAKIVGFLLSARQATLRSLFGGAMGDVRALS